MPIYLGPTLMAGNSISAQHPAPDAFYFDNAFYITIVLAVFTIFFGARHLEANRRHEGLIAAIAFESVFKLIAFLALFVFLGGLSAATGMVIVATTALSIMLSNNLVLPFLLRTASIRESLVDDLSNSLIGIRRLSIGIILLLAYGYFHLIGKNYTLVSIGLISFVAVAQFAPSLLGGIY